jgi:AcrR family transcriptional regulator
MAPRPSPRDRLHDALLELCFERGFTRVDLGALLARSEVDRAAFDREFADLEACFLAVFRAEVEAYRRPPPPPSGWLEQVRARAYSLYRFLAADRRRSRFFVVDARAAGEPTLLFAGQLIEELFDLIDAGRQELADPTSLTRATAESTGGGIFNQLYAILGRGAVLPPEAEIVPQLMYCIVLPYLGPAAALRELEIPPPPTAAEPRSLDAPRG